MGNAIYRKQGGVSEYQYWTSSFGLSPLKTKDYPFQFIESYDGDYFLYLSPSIFEAYSGNVKTKTLGKKYKANGFSWDYVEDLNPSESFTVSGEPVYANADIEMEPM